MPGDRTEQATPHRREKARHGGDLLQSRELSAAAGMLVGVLTLGGIGAGAIRAWRDELIACLALTSPAHWDTERTVASIEAMRRSTLGVLIPIAFVMAAVAVSSLCVGLVQTRGVNFAFSALSLRFDRLDPATNLKNLFTVRAAARMGKSLLPVAVLAVLALQRIERQFNVPPFSTTRLDRLWSDVYGLVLTAAVLLFAWALVDYAVEWRSREARLKMSRDELREELKETEGNPQTRSRIRGLLRQARRRRIKADVSKAAVVLTNPTHFAVALGFDFVAMNAPRVLAKGRNLLAEEIKAEARWAGVPIIENPPLARSLYRSVEIGRPIPVDLYAAVAAVLAFLYRQRVEEEIRARRNREMNAREATASTPAAAEPGRAARGQVP
jgi:flagellar biosynthesis protein FlhB